MVWIKHRITLLNKIGEVVSTRLYTHEKRKKEIIKRWKYTYGKKFLELRVEDEKEVNTKTK